MFASVWSRTADNPSHDLFRSAAVQSYSPPASSDVSSESTLQYSIKHGKAIPPYIAAYAYGIPTARQRAESASALYARP